MYAHTAEIHQELKLWMLAERHKFHTACMAYRCQHVLVPEYLIDIYQYVSDVHAHDTRNATYNSLFVNSNNSESGKCMFRNRSVILREKCHFSSIIQEGLYCYTTNLRNNIQLRYPPFISFLLSFITCLNV